MELIKKTLAACPLFSQLTDEERNEVAAQIHFYIRKYDRDEVVAFEEEECSAIGIVASGGIHIQRVYASGRTITIETFRTGDSFGEALVFAENCAYPATLVTQEETTVVYISREEIIALCSRYPHFLRSFLRTLSERILLLNRKIKSLSYQTVRQKVANFLLEERRQQKSDLLTLKNSRHELADSLGIPRPSLSRELIALRDEGWIDFDRRTVKILDRGALESVLRK